MDLLPREEYNDEFEDLEEEEFDQEDDSRARLSVQRVMKNAGAGEKDVEISDDGYHDYDDSDELTEPLFDEDDDMEYSFLGNRRRR